MKPDREHYSNDFHDRAKGTLLSLFDAFKRATASLDRSRQENAFQQLQGQYSAQLKLELESIAQETLEHAGSAPDAAGWRQALTRFIQEYGKEFQSKARSL